MKIQTAAQIGVCSWSLQATGPHDLVQKVQALGLKKLQLGLTPHRDDPGTWEGVREILGAAGISIVSGMFCTAGEDYTTPETIRRTGGIVPDEHWQENRGGGAPAAGRGRQNGRPAGAGARGPRPPPRPGGGGGPPPPTPHPPPGGPPPPPETGPANGSETREHSRRLPAP